MSSPTAVPAVFPSLGATQSRPSRVTPGALSPFASIAVPVPAPKAAEVPADVFPELEEIKPAPRAAAPVGPDPAELERIRSEAAAAGYAEGYAEGAERGTREGLERGFEQGRREAYEAEMAQHQILLDAFANALQAKVDAMNAQLAGWLQEREEAMADLAMDVVRRLLSHELESSRASILSIAQEALGELSHGTHARIRINPFDVPILDRHRSQLIAASSSLRDIDLVEDPSILGGCLVETDGGVVDASLDTRLALLEETWREAA